MWIEQGIKYGGGVWGGLGWGGEGKGHRLAMWNKTELT